MVTELRSGGSVGSKFGREVCCSFLGGFFFLFFPLAVGVSKGARSGMACGSAGLWDGTRSGGILLGLRVCV